MSAALATNGTNHGLRRYAEALGSRRAVKRLLGPDTDPDYCLTDFLFKVATFDAERLRKVYGAERTKAPLGQTGGPSGGYLVPEDLRLDLMQDVAEDAYVRPRATVVPMGSSTQLLALPDATTAPAAGTAFAFGSILMKWTQEQNTRPETEPQFRNVTLRAWDLTGYALQSNTLYRDGGGGLESFMRKIFARSIAWYEDYAYLQGSGAGQPYGIVNHPAAKTVSRQTPVQVTLQDVFKMSAALLPASWARAIWLMSVSVWNWIIVLGSTSSPPFQINQPVMGSRDIKADGGGTSPHFVLNGQVGFVTEKLPSVGTQGDLVLIDPLLYVIGDRGAVEVAVSMHEPTAFLKNQAVWRVTYRGDGQPWFSKTITLSDGSTTVSPYVILV